MGPEQYPSEPRGVLAGANIGAQLKEESPIQKSMFALEKSVDFLNDVIGHHSNKIQSALSPQGTESISGEKDVPMAPRSDLANSIQSRAQAIYALARQLEELTSRVEL